MRSAYGRLRAYAWGLVADLCFAASLRAEFSKSHRRARRWADWGCRCIRNQVDAIGEMRG